MIRMRIFLILFILSSSFCFSQSSGIFISDTAVFNLQSRQLTQFVNRFNNEDPQFKFEDKFVDGINLARKKNLVYLLNLQDTTLVYDTLTTQFIDFVAKSNNSNRISYFDSAWYAVAHCNITYKGKSAKVALTLKPEGNSGDGYKWSIVGVDPFLTIDNIQDSTNNKLSPYNNEVNFVDLHHFFTAKEQQLSFMSDDFNPDYLTILIYLINNAEIEFYGVNHITYYFFQIENYYFTVENFVRPNDASSGWLISSIKQSDYKTKRHLIENKLFTKN